MTSKEIIENQITKDEFFAGQAVNFSQFLRSIEETGLTKENQTILNNLIDDYFWLQNCYKIVPKSPKERFFE